MIIRNLAKTLVLFIIGGSSYYFLEVLWRGYSHLSMFILGGICFISIGLIGDSYFRDKGNLISQLVLYSGLITLLELIFGLVLNVKFKLNIWDYSHFKYNFMGQISLIFSLLWLFLSYPALLLYRFLDRNILDNRIFKIN